MKKWFSKIFHSYYFWIGILVFLIIGVVIFFYPYVYKQAFLNNYNNKNLGFSFAYPKSWEELGKRESGMHYPDADIIFVNKKNQDINFGIRIKDIDGKEIDVSKSIEELRNTFSKKLDNFKEIEAKESKVDGLTAVVFSYNYSVKKNLQGDKWLGSQKQVLFIKDKKLYALIFTSPQELFTKSSRDFDIIFSSFQFND